jgi:peptide/nickel transport system substrate-binding protein
MHRALACAAIAAMGCTTGPDDSRSTPPAARPLPDGRLKADEWTGAAVDGGTLTVIIPNEPAGLLYLVLPDLTLSRITVPHVYETLLTPDAHDETGQQLVPRLAESYSVSPDGLVTTFVLRAGVRWHDGQPFSADDVVFTFDRVMDPNGRSGHLRSSFTDLRKWEKVDDRTVRFTFDKPYFLTLDALGGVEIIPRHVFESGELTKNPAVRRPVGTGPFRFESWEPGSKRIVYRRNEDYWGAKAHVDTLVFRVVEDRTVAAQLMERGDADFYRNYLPDQWLRLADEPDFLARHRLVRGTTGGFTYVSLNERRPFFADKRVRRAMAQLLNRPYVEQKLLKGLYADHECALQFDGPDCDPALLPPGYDPTQARALLDAAGWTDHDGDGSRDKDGVPLRFTYVYPNGSIVAEQVGTLLRDELHRSGIEMEMQVLEWGTFSSRLRHGEFDATCLAAGGDPRSDPFSMFHSSQTEGRNFAAFHNPEADRLLEAARVELDDGRRHVLYKAFGRLLADEQPFIWLGTAPTLGALSRRVHGARNVREPEYAEWWLAPEAP